MKYIENEYKLKFGLNFRKHFIRLYGLSIERMNYILDLKISQLIDLCYKNMKQEEGKMKNVEENVQMIGGGVFNTPDEGIIK